MPRVTGIVKVTVDGELQRSKDGAKLNIGGFERTAVSGFEIYGYAQKVMPSDIEFTIAHMADTDLEKLADLIDVSVRFECDTGVVTRWCHHEGKVISSDDHPSLIFDADAWGS